MHNSYQSMDVDDIVIGKCEQDICLTMNIFSFQTVTPLIDYSAAVLLLEKKLSNYIMITRQ